MKEYKMGRGEYLEERVPDLKATIEEYFGPVTGREAYDGSDLYVVDDPDNPLFDRVVIGAAKYDGKKDRLAVSFEERPVEEILEEGLEDAAEEAVDLKNEFLLKATGRDAKSRRESMKRDVEDDAPDY
ncbi:MAG: DUF5611 family protein [Halobacteriaceae archaeon]